MNVKRRKTSLLHHFVREYILLTIQGITKTKIGIVAP